MGEAVSGRVGLPRSRVRWGPVGSGDSALVVSGTVREAEKPRDVGPSEQSPPLVPVSAGPWLRVAPSGSETF